MLLQLVLRAVGRTLLERRLEDRAEFGTVEDGADLAALAVVTRLDGLHALGCALDGQERRPARLQRLVLGPLLPDRVQVRILGRRELVDLDPEIRRPLRQFLQLVH